MKRTKILVGCVGMVLLCTIPVLIIVVEDEIRNRRLDDLHASIDPFPDSVLVFNSEPSLSPAAGSISCDTFHRLDLYGVDAPFSAILDFFREQFNGRDWAERDTGIFTVDNKTSIFVAQVTGLQSQLYLGISRLEFDEAKKAYETLYHVHISNERKEECL